MSSQQTEEEEGFWSAIASLRSDPEHTILREVDRQHIVLWYRIFDQLRADAFDVIQSRFLPEEISEDTIIDLADAVVAMGRTAWQQCTAGIFEYPPREQWESLPTVDYMFDEIYFERFGTPIQEEID